MALSDHDLLQAHDVSTRMTEFLQANTDGPRNALIGLALTFASISVTSGSEFATQEKLRDDAFELIEAIYDFVLEKFNALQLTAQ